MLPVDDTPVLKPGPHPKTIGLAGRRGIEGTRFLVSLRVRFARLLAPIHDCNTLVSARSVKDLLFGYRSGF